MKKLFLFLLVMVISLPTQAQKTYDQCIIKYEGGQKGMQINGDDGTIVVVSKKDDGKIVKHQDFYVGVINNSNKEYNFNPTSIKVEAINKGKKEVFKVYSCDEWIKKEKTRILLWGPNNSETQSVKTQIKDANGITKSTIESKSEIITNANDEARANAEAEINARYFKRVTIPNGQVRYGMVVAKNPKSQNLILTIPVNNNIYVFDLSKE